VHVSHVQASTSPRTGRKSAYQFNLSHVLGAEDHDGASVSAEAAQGYIRNLVDKVGRFKQEGLTCAGNWATDRLPEPATQTCRLRPKRSEQCCCSEASLLEQELCFPVSGTAEEDHQVLDGVITETQKTFRVSGAEHALTRTITVASVKQPDPPKEEMRAEILNRPVPDVAVPDVAGRMEWDWERVDTQWDSVCVDSRTLPFWREQRESWTKKWVTHTTHNKRMEYKRNTQHHTKRMEYTDYVQDSKLMCVAWRLSRRCGPGQGLYRQKIPQGSCFDEDKLTALGNLMYQCPAGYMTGTNGFPNFHGECQCGRQQCAHHP